jgi:hypothetical protein
LVLHGCDGTPLNPIERSWDFSVHVGVLNDALTTFRVEFGEVDGSEFFGGNIEELGHAKGGLTFLGIEGLDEVHVLSENLLSIVIFF